MFGTYFKCNFFKFFTEPSRIDVFVLMLFDTDVTVFNNNKRHLQAFTENFDKKMEKAISSS